MLLGFRLACLLNIFFAFLYSNIFAYKVIDLTYGDRVLGDNQLNGALDMGTSYSSHLKLIDLQNNLISDAPKVIDNNISLM